MIAGDSKRTGMIQIAFAVFDDDDLLRLRVSFASEQAAKL
jgi:hypothetical protein